MLWQNMKINKIMKKTKKRTSGRVGLNFAQALQGAYFSSRFKFLHSKTPLSLICALAALRLSRFALEFETICDLKKRFQKSRQVRLIKVTQDNTFHCFFVARIRTSSCSYIFSLTNKFESSVKYTTCSTETYCARLNI